MILLAVLALVAQDAESLSQAGARAMREGHFEEAARIYRQLLAQPGSTPEWRLNLGLALHASGDYALALEEFRRFVAAVSKPGPGHLMMGVDLIKLGQACEAVGPLSAARKWRSTPDVLGPLADAYTGCKRYADAAAILLELKEPYRAARAYWLARDYEKARPLYAGAAGQHAGEPEFDFEYGDTLLRIEGAEQALPHLERAQAILEARGALGRAYVELGRCTDAVPHLEAASNQDSSLLLPLSRCYGEAGRQAEARRVLEQYKQRSGGARK